MYSRSLHAPPVALAFALAMLIHLTTPGPAAAQSGAPATVAHASADPLAHMTPALWREDLAYLADRIRTVHPAPFRYLTAAEFDSAVQALDRRIPDLTDEAIVVELLRVMALTRDGHTTARMGFPGFGEAALEQLRFHQLPLHFFAFEEGVYVTQVDEVGRGDASAASNDPARVAAGGQSGGPAATNLVGRRVTAIDGVPIDSALALASRTAPADNRYGAIDHGAQLLRVPEMLRGMGIEGAPLAIALTTEVDGDTRTDTVRADDVQPYALRPPPGPEPPLYLRNPDRPYWAEYQPASGTMYVQYNVVQNRGEKSIEEFFDGAFAEAETKQAGSFVLDMRFNTGGNNSLNWPIIYDILRSDRFNQRGRLFVVIGRRTFSAAQNGVNWLERHTEAVFVGEPTAAHPNHYGDALGFTLPNSGFPFQVSSLYWQHHPRDTREWTAPEIYAPPTAEAYFAGRDPALEAIASWNAESIFDRLTAALESRRVDAAVAEYRAFQADPRNRFVDVESDLNRFGYMLMRSGDAAGALGVFRLVTEAYPASANAWDSYGEGLWRLGRVDEAVEAYERAVALDPDGFVGRNSRSMLERIEAGEGPP